MNKIILLMALLYGGNAIGGSGFKIASFPLKGGFLYTAGKQPLPASDTTIVLNSEDDVKAKLIFLALKNSQAVAADANVHIAEIARRKASSSFLGSVSLGGNVNEFVINNSPAANFFPKYNFGLAIPLDMFAKNRAEKRTADEMIIISSSQKILVAEALKARILTQYENYKEKKLLVELQRITTEDDIAAYEKAQKDYKEENSTLEEVNKLYREVITSRGNLATKEKELNIVIIAIEEIIGVPFKTVLEKRQN